MDTIAIYEVRGFGRQWLAPRKPRRLNGYKLTSVSGDNLPTFAPDRPGQPREPLPAVAASPPAVAW